MRVLMVTNAVEPDKIGGLERYVRQLAAALVREGAAVTVLAKRIGPAPLEEVGDDGVRIVRHPVPSKSDPLFALRYPFAPFAAVRRETRRPFDVLHAHFTVPAVPLAIARRRYVYTFHAPVHRELLSERQGSYALPAPVQRGAVAGLRRAERFALERASRVFVLSEFMRAELARFAPAAASSARLIPGGLDVARFSPGDPTSGPDGRVGGTRPLLFSARRLTPRTGVRELVEAMPAIIDRIPGARLAVGGVGGMDAEIRATIARLGLESAVEMLGWLTEDELIGWYRRADLVVMPSQALEGFGLTTAEALACGTPVVATPVGANPEVLGPLDPRLITDDPSPRAIAEGVVRVLQNPELLAGAADGARQRALELRWEVVAARYLEEYATFAR